MLNLCYQKTSAMWKALLIFVKQARRATKTGGIAIIFAVTYEIKVSTVLSHRSHGFTFVKLVLIFGPVRSYHGHTCHDILSRFFLQII